MRQSSVVKLMFSGVQAVCLALAAATSAHAALIAGDLDANAANGYEVFYDTVLDITWLADANYAKTSGFDTDGAMDWSKAMSWASNLQYFGVDDWRLPHFDPVNGIRVVDYPSAYDGSTDAGYNITSPRNELAYMYYVNLGLKGSISPSGVPDFTAGVSGPAQAVPGIEGAFVKNLRPNMYWTNVIANDTLKAWGLWTTFPVAGAHGYDYRYNDHYAWAVTNGDAFKLVPTTPPVPEPSALWMLLAGLGIAGFAWRRQQKRLTAETCVA